MYVLSSKPRKKNLLSEQLGLRRVETFVSYIQAQGFIPRARKVRLNFPGYINTYIGLDKSGSSTPDNIPGSAGLILFGGTLACIPDGLVYTIRQRLSAIDAAGGELFEALQPGEPAIIHSAPFAGYNPIFGTRLPGTERIRALLKILHARQISVNLPAG